MRIELSQEQIEDYTQQFKNLERSKTEQGISITPRTKKQIINRKKSKAAKKSRKINRK